MYYLDNAATTPLTNNVKNKIISILDDFGNPSSSYDLGKKTKNIIEDTRDAVRKFMHVPANYDVIFTSSGSASNCLAIDGLTKDRGDYVVIYSPTAHKSMVKCCKKYLYSFPMKIDEHGFINQDDLRDLLEDTYETTSNIIVCFEAANSELGTIQQIRELTKLIHYYHGIAIVDFTGYIPYYSVNLIDCDVDIATFSGHKLHALKGVGVLCKHEDLFLEPMVYGSQESGYFAGTENVIGIASLGEAINNYKYDFVTSYQRDCLWEMIQKEIPNCYLIGSSSYKRLPFNLFICFKGINGSDLAAMLETNDIYVSTGSACNNGSSEPSNALVAIGMNQDDYFSCIRITFSGKENYVDLVKICKNIKECVEFLRGR